MIARERERNDEGRGSLAHACRCLSELKLDKLREGEGSERGRAAGHASVPLWSTHPLYNSGPSRTPHFGKGEGLLFRHVRSGAERASGREIRSERRERNI